MLKYGINDLRAFFETDYQWLSHFGFDLWCSQTTEVSANDYYAFMVKEHLKTNANENEIIEKLTNIGLEVESVKENSKGLGKFKIVKFLK